MYFSQLSKIKSVPLKKILLLFSLFFLTSCTDEKIVKVKIKEKIYHFEIANTSEKRSKGLMFRPKLKKEGGMLFVYSYSDYRFFYMKNTLLPLDIAFIDADQTIVTIKSMDPLDETTISSEKKAMYALEVNRGFFQQKGIQVGDKIEILSPIKYYP